MKAYVYLAVIAATSVASSARADNGVAARVNGKPISAADVQKLADKIASGAKTTADQVWNDARDQLVAVETLVQAATAEKLSASAAEIDAELKDLKAQLGTAEQFQKTLAESKSTEAEFREEMRRGILVQKLLDRHVKVKVSDQEVESYYKENQDQFERPEMIKASHILVKVPAGAGAESARNRAAEILARAKKGEDFEKLAKELSEDPMTKDKGGDLGLFPNRRTPVAEAAFALKPGEISEIVESPYGLHVIKAFARQAAGTTSFNDAKEGIRAQLEDDQREDKEDAYVGEVEKKAKIEILQDKKAEPKGGTKQGAMNR